MNKPSDASRNYPSIEIPSKLCLIYLYIRDGVVIDQELCQSAAIDILQREEITHLAIRETKDLGSVLKREVNRVDLDVDCAIVGVDRSDGSTKVLRYGKFALLEEYEGGLLGTWIERPQGGLIIFSNFEVVTFII